MKQMRDSVSDGRVAAMASFGFTERQARFLVTVMVYGGAFLERQYCTFAGIAHGQKTHDFVRKLIDRGYVTVITPGALHRGRLYHLQYKPLYEAIGEPNNRNRRPATMGRMVERLMVLDAVLADRRYTWLGTEQDKVAYFKSTFEQRGIGADPCLPHLVFGTGPEKVIRYFPDKMPIGLERDYGPRHVFLFLVTSDVPAAFRMFLFRHADLLGTVRAMDDSTGGAAPLPEGDRAVSVRRQRRTRHAPHPSISRRTRVGLSASRRHGGSDPACTPISTSPLPSGSSPRHASGRAIACGKWTRPWRCGASGRPSCATNSHAAKDGSNSWNCRTSTCASPRWSAWRDHTRRANAWGTTPGPGRLSPSHRGASTCPVASFPWSAHTPAPVTPLRHRSLEGCLSDQRRRRVPPVSALVVGSGEQAGT